MFVLIAFLLLLRDWISESWEQKFRRIGAYSIVISVHDIIICSMVKSGIDLSKVVLDGDIIGAISNNNYVLILICYTINLLCGGMFYNYDKIRRACIMFVCCVAHILSSCIIFSHTQSLGSCFLIVSSISYVVGLYQCFKKK